MLEYASILLLGLLAAAVGLFMLFANALFGPKRPSRIKAQPFECGREPFALPGGRMPIHFYVLAMLFVVFDVELVFLFPWAVLVRELGWFGLLEMGFFLLIVIAGFVYAWKQGALEWGRRNT
jgi:NADH-quinone oxidoreductase subunit A